MEIDTTSESAVDVCRHTVCERVSKAHETFDIESEGEKRVIYKGTSIENRPLWTVGCGLESGLPLGYESIYRLKGERHRIMFFCDRSLFCFCSGSGTHPALLDSVQ